MKKSPVSHLQVTAEHAGRRLDNFLLGYLGNIPKSRVYQMLRKGEVRVNAARARQGYRLQAGDILRLPPVYSPSSGQETAPPGYLLNKLQDNVLYEDQFLIVINKPAGIAVHAGKSEPFGIIELLRHSRPTDSVLELVHRLDKPTSGCLLVARDHRVLRQLHEQLRDGSVEKYYLALLMGEFKSGRQVNNALRINRHQATGKKVRIADQGKAARSLFQPLAVSPDATLTRVRITTGKTHQIRVHAAGMGHPVAGDMKYGDRAFNRAMSAKGLKRMFLHAWQMKIRLPYNNEYGVFTAPLPQDLQDLAGEMFNEYVSFDEVS